LIWLVRKIQKAQEVRANITSDSDIEKQAGTTLQKGRQANPTKYATSKLSETTKKQYLKIIIQQLEAHKAYRQPNLTLKQFAKQANLPQQHISQVYRPLPLVEK